MGIFDKITKIVGMVEKVGEIIDNVDEGNKSSNQNSSNNEKNAANKVKALVLSSVSRDVEAMEYADDCEYTITFKLNADFKEAKSHAGEVPMIYTYAPDSEYGEEGNMPCVTVQMDDEVYCAVEEFKEKGTFDGAIELIPLDGRFFFKAKREYYGDMMYFYGIDRCDGFWENNGLCMTYPKSYVGTENEVKLMNVLDEVARTYSEKKK